VEVFCVLPAEIIRQIRRLQLRARRAVEDLLGGEYHSVFKGTGLSFEEVREYQPGDDVRSIDWNVTARMGSPFVKRYVEERERTLLLVTDISGSQGFGTRRHVKRAVIAELAALLSFSAIHNNDRVGLIAFSDCVELFIPPGKGTRHALRLIREILYGQAKHPGTSVATALDFLQKVQRRRAIVFLMSDFLDRNFERPLRLAARRHDLTLVRVDDPFENELPAVGLVQVEDAETGLQYLIDTSNREARVLFAERGRERREHVAKLARGSALDLIEVSTDGQHLDALVRFFQRRERRLRRR
jgi:uncharacterized protein (DUF58 family)